MRGAAPVTLTVRATRHGPVISDVLPARHGRSRLCAGACRRPFSTTTTAAPRRCGRSTAPPTGTSFRDALQGLRRRRSRTWSMPMSTARSALSRRRACRSAARATAGCRRRAGPASTIGPASSRSTSCRSAVNPASGHFVSANNKIVPDSYPYFLGARLGSAEPRRAHRANCSTPTPRAIAGRERRDPGRHAVARWRGGWCR